MARTQEELLLSVADVLLIDNKSGLEYASATLASHNISQSVDSSEIRAGRKNAVICTLESNKTITVEVEDVHANRDWIAIAMDAELVEQQQAFDARHLPVKLVLAKQGTGADLTVTLPKEPKDAAAVKFFNSKREEVTPDSNADGVFTFTESDTLKAGDVLETSSFVYVVAPKEADVMEIGGEGVGRSFSMFLEETVMNNDMEVIATKTTFFPRVVPDSSFTMEGTSELAEQNVTYTFTVVQADGYDYLGQIYYVKAE